MITFTVGLLLHVAVWLCVATHILVTVRYHTFCRLVTPRCYVAVALVTPPHLLYTLWLPLDYRLRLILVVDSATHVAFTVARSFTTVATGWLHLRFTLRCGLPRLVTFAVVVTLPTFLRYVRDLPLRFAFCTPHALHALRCGLRLRLRLVDLHTLHLRYVRCGFWIYVVTFYVAFYTPLITDFYVFAVTLPLYHTFTYGLPLRITTYAFTFVVIYGCGYRCYHHVYVRLRLRWLPVDFDLHARTGCVTAPRTRRLPRCTPHRLLLRSLPRSTLICRTFVLYVGYVAFTTHTFPVHVTLRYRSLQFWLVGFLRLRLPATALVACGYTFCGCVTLVVVGFATFAVAVRCRCVHVWICVTGCVGFCGLVATVYVTFTFAFPTFAFVARLRYTFTLLPFVRYRIYTRLRCVRYVDLPLRYIVIFTTRWLHSPHVYGCCCSFCWWLFCSLLLPFTLSLSFYRCQFPMPPHVALSFTLRSSFTR